MPADREVEDLLRPGVAIVVCTCDRPKSLQGFLRSLAAEGHRPAQLIIVDGSRTDATHQLLEIQDARDLAGAVQYFRVPPHLRGLTRQRNFGLRHVSTDLVAFFDDDVQLLPGCLREMEAAHRLLGPRAVGVGARIEGGQQRPGALWRLRRFLRVVSSLRPGAYEPSGMSIPWWGADQENGLLEGDWLPGGATMWKTAIAREVGFNEAFEGYGQGEDLDFCLRIRGKGKLFLAPAARVKHLRNPEGRPDPYVLGYMEIRNRYQIHREALPARHRRETIWFFYAWIVDTLLLARDLFRPGRGRFGLRRMMGRLGAMCDIIGLRVASS
ncbi:MAG TPA: glycosyltransferase [bacterium]|nr:glycosyltransferase [bacterium]